MLSLGPDVWDWVICHNGLTQDDLTYLNNRIKNAPGRVALIPQNWALCPVPDHCQTPRRRDGSFEWNGTKCGGTMWKVCPARMRMETHEIVMDNDVILLNKFPQIDEWLDQTEKGLVLEEPIRFYGRYDALFPPDEPCLNSGFMGFPPGYDFGSAIMDNWVRHGRYMNLSQADEQGLLTYSLNQQPNIRVHNTQMIEILARDYNAEISGSDYAYHFTQANRIPHHIAWEKYKEKMSNSVTI